MAGGGRVDGLLGIAAGRAQVAERAQRIRVLGLHQSGLHVTGLRRLLTGPDSGGGVLGAAHRGVAAVPVPDPRVGLGLQRVQVADQRRRQRAAGAAQRGLRIRDHLPVPAAEQRLVR
jgi:hypothetical protein